MCKLVLGREAESRRASGSCSLRVHDQGRKQVRTESGCRSGGGGGCVAYSSETTQVLLLHTGGALLKGQ